ncbi:FeoB-associated Cys-rich membrane protein [Youngiibacter multivorans]|uniref:Positive regulator of sigma E activity n=1 Tax=Youngiibacter multivorans TaxID=937251 RepID=A0ABS4G0H5_9CLOT|nr:FeoB-associated Cys-rich membrane protein [Youngiibacter multivorans]MBP1918055.1 positive regulator of sigma E activity [Youngiibacter multivorans]
MEIIIALAIFATAGYFVVKSLRKSTAGDCGSCSSCSTRCSSFKDDEGMKFIDR